MTTAPDKQIAMTVAKLAAVVVMMFAFVFVVMVPLYDVLCDALGINGKTSGQAYEAVQIQVDESREITIQFIASNNDGMPWEFRPSQTIMRVNPGVGRDRLSVVKLLIDPAATAQLEDVAPRARHHGGAALHHLPLAARAGNRFGHDPRFVPAFETHSFVLVTSSRQPHRRA